MRAHHTFATQPPAMLLPGPVAATPSLWLGDVVRAPQGLLPSELPQTGVVVRRHWFRRVTISWACGGFSTLPARELTRDDCR